MAPRITLLVFGVLALAVCAVAQFPVTPLVFWKGEANQVKTNAAPPMYFGRTCNAGLFSLTTVDGIVSPPNTAAVDEGWVRACNAAGQPLSNPDIEHYVVLDAYNFTPGVTRAHLGDPLAITVSNPMQGVGRVYLDTAANYCSNFTSYVICDPQEVAGNAECNGTLPFTMPTGEYLVCIQIIDSLTPIASAVDGWGPMSGGPTVQVMQYTSQPALVFQDLEANFRMTGDTPCDVGSTVRLSSESDCSQPAGGWVHTMTCGASKELTPGYTPTTNATLYVCAPTNYTLGRQDTARLVRAGIVTVVVTPNISFGLEEPLVRGFETTVNTSSADVDTLFLAANLSCLGVPIATANVAGSQKGTLALPTADVEGLDQQSIALCATSSGTTFFVRAVGVTNFTYDYDLLFSAPGASIAINKSTPLGHTFHVMSDLACPAAGVPVATVQHDTLTALNFTAPLPAGTLALCSQMTAALRATVGTLLVYPVASFTPNLTRTPFTTVTVSDVPDGFNIAIWDGTACDSGAALGTGSGNSTTGVPIAVALSIGESAVCARYISFSTFFRWVLIGAVVRVTRTATTSPTTSASFTASVSPSPLTASRSIFADTVTHTATTSSSLLRTPSVGSPTPSGSPTSSASLLLSQTPGSHTVTATGTTTETLRVSPTVASPTTTATLTASPSQSLSHTAGSLTASAVSTATASPPKTSSPSRTPTGAITPTTTPLPPRLDAPANVSACVPFVVSFPTTPVLNHNDTLFVVYNGTSCSCGSSDPAQYLATAYRANNSQLAELVIPHSAMADAVLNTTTNYNETTFAVCAFNVALAACVSGGTMRVSDALCPPPSTGHNDSAAYVGGAPAVFEDTDLWLVLWIVAGFLLLCLLLLLCCLLIYCCCRDDADKAVADEEEVEEQHGFVASDKTTVGLYGVRPADDEERSLHRCFRKEVPLRLAHGGTPAMHKAAAGEEATRALIEQEERNARQALVSALLAETAIAQTYSESRKRSDVKADQRTTVGDGETRGRKSIADDEAKARAVISADVKRREEQSQARLRERSRRIETVEELVASGKRNPLGDGEDFEFDELPARGDDAGLDDSADNEPYDELPAHSGTAEERYVSTDPTDDYLPDYDAPIRPPPGHRSSSAVVPGLGMTPEQRRRETIRRSILLSPQGRRSLTPSGRLMGETPRRSASGSPRRSVMVTPRRSGSNTSLPYGDAVEEEEGPVFY